MSSVEITVIKVLYDAALAEEYLTDGNEAGPCPFHEAGQRYVYEGEAEKPDGLCPWAWIDIYRSVSAIAAGATNKPWNKRDSESILCCTDGIRPVIFRIRRIDEQTAAEIIVQNSHDE